MSDREYDNTNRGVLFKNDKEGGNPNWPDYRGSINVDGKEFWLDAWIKESKKPGGKKFMSLTVKPKVAREHQGASGNPPAQYADKGGDPF
jgi:hypothetical protein